MKQRLVRGLLRGLVRTALKPALRASVPVPLQRLALASARPVLRSDARVRVELAQIGALHCERVTPPRARNDAVMLFLHGGGYCIGSPVSHRPLTTALAAASGLSLCVPDYRLAPEHPFPAALDDALEAYRALAEAGGAVILAGDSAGGGLALALALALGREGLPRPAGLLLLSPWVDLECTGDSMQARAARDPMLTRAGLRRWARLYAAGRERAPACSPLHADLAGLPPVHIQTGTDEVLYDDARRLHARLAAAQVEVTLREYPGLWHDFQLHAGVLAAADEAVAELARGAVAMLQLAAAPSAG